MKTEEILALLIKESPEGIFELQQEDDPVSIIVPKEILYEVLILLRDHELLYFDMLSCLTGIDNGPELNTMELIYNLYSIPFEMPLMIKTRIDRLEGLAPSVSVIWRTADWHERGVYDLLGIRFDGHPDMRRILLPSDWEGHPLRKDAPLQERYHGIKVAY
jgi:NADH-quinone oxidoreductase subunit C